MSLAVTPHFAPRNAFELLRPLACTPLPEDAPEPGEEPVQSQARASASTSTPRAAFAAEAEALYRRHHRLVFRVALRYGGGNTAWAEDVTQDVFVDLLKAL